MSGISLLKRTWFNIKGNINCPLTAGKVASITPSHFLINEKLHRSVWNAIIAMKKLWLKHIQPQMNSCSYLNEEVHINHNQAHNLSEKRQSVLHDLRHATLYSGMNEAGQADCYVDIFEEFWADTDPGRRRGGRLWFDIMLIAQSWKLMENVWSNLKMNYNFLFCLSYHDYMCQCIFD